jgi:hypothetical protein
MPFTDKNPSPADFPLPDIFSELKFEAENQK